MPGSRRKRRWRREHVRDRRRQGDPLRVPIRLLQLGRGGELLFQVSRGLSHECVEAISEHKNEPEWMRKFRHKSLDYFLARPLPTWGGNVAEIDFDSIYYYIRPTEKQADKWEDRRRHPRHLGQARHPGGGEVTTSPGLAPSTSRVVTTTSSRPTSRHRACSSSTWTRACASARTSSSSTSRTIIPQNDNKFAALNDAVWSGGSFIYVPPGCGSRCRSRLLPHQCGEHGPVRADADHRRRGRLRALRRGGCRADPPPTRSTRRSSRSSSSRAGRCRYTTIQNWSNNVYNLVTKRAVAYEGATMEWVDGNLGSKLTMKYPAIWLMGERAHGEVLSIAFAGKRQHQDAGGKCVHVAPNTTSVINSKSISKDGGRAGYRGLLEVAKGARRQVEESRLRRAHSRRGLALRHLSLHPRRRERRRPCTRRPSRRSARNSCST